MGRLTAIMLCIIFFMPAANAAGDTTLQLQYEKTIEGNFSNFYTDNLGNIFLVTQKNQVKK